MDTSSIPSRSPRGSPTPSGRDSPTRAEVPKYTSIYLSAILRLSPKLTFPSFLPFLVHFLRRSSVPSLRKRTVREGPPPQWALEQQSNGGRGPLPPLPPSLPPYPISSFSPPHRPTAPAPALSADRPATDTLFSRKAFRRSLVRPLSAAGELAPPSGAAQGHMVRAPWGEARSPGKGLQKG